MDLIGIKEKINKIRFFMENIRYKRGKNLYFSIFFLILLISSIFSIVIIVQKKEINKKDNILKSYIDAENPNINMENNLIKNDITSADNSNNSLENNNNLASKNTPNDISSDVLNNSSTGKEVEEKFTIKAYICGCVVNPGVYELESGVRVIDLLDKAGGPKKEACLEAINLALLLSDCQRIYVPSVDEIKKGKSLFFSINDFNSLFSGNNNDSSSNNNLNNTSVVQLININLASSAELESLPGIGSKIAKDIIDYRNKYGFFSNKEDIKNVKGIGDKKYEKIKDLISV
jgi:competence protein ComEA